jgi:hypothetical protein
MTSPRQRWLHYGLVIAAILCSSVSLFALAEMGAPRWTISLDILALIFILLAVKMRDRSSGLGDGDGA